MMIYYTNGAVRYGILLNSNPISVERKIEDMFILPLERYVSPVIMDQLLKHLINTTMTYITDHLVDGKVPEINFQEINIDMLKTYPLYRTYLSRKNPSKGYSGRNDSYFWEKTSLTGSLVVQNIVYAKELAQLSNYRDDYSAFHYQLSAKGMGERLKDISDKVMTLSQKLEVDMCLSYDSDQSSYIATAIAVDEQIGENILLDLPLAINKGKNSRAYELIKNPPSAVYPKDKSNNEWISYMNKLRELFTGVYRESDVRINIRVSEKEGVISDPYIVATVYKSTSFWSSENTLERVVYPKVSVDDLFELLVLSTSPYMVAILDFYEAIDGLTDVKLSKVLRKTACDLIDTVE
jgi:hypothetical protein